MNAEAIIPRFLLRHPCAPKSRATSLPAVIEVLQIGLIVPVIQPTRRNLWDGLNMRRLIGICGLLRRHAELH